MTAHRKRLGWRIAEIAIPIAIGVILGFITQAIIMVIKITA